jgi:hypothetical protein
MKRPLVVVNLLEMRRWTFFLLLLAVPGWTQSAQGPPPIVSPEVLPDHRVMFRFRAPNAKEILLAREGAKRVPLQKDAQGVWTITTDPLEPHYYAYSFIVDGVALIDPMNPLTRPNLLNTQSVVHVPGAASLPWETNRVPRGTIHHHFYRSQVVDDERDFFVYTPPVTMPVRRSFTRCFTCSTVTAAMREGGSSAGPPT